MAGEWYHLLYDRVYGIRSCALRLTNTYGPRMRIKDARQTFLGVWIRNLLRAEPLQVFGDGKQIRDFNYVDDVVEALLAAALSADTSGQVYNLGADDPISLQATAELLIKIHGGGTYEMVPFPGDRKAIDIGDYYADYRRIRSQLGWTPSTSLADGLRKTLEYYRVHYAEYV
jgi:UDP-glucose 4-epimerase